MPSAAVDPIVKVAVICEPLTAFTLVIVTPVPLMLTVVPPVTKFTPEMDTLTTVPTFPLVGAIDVTPGEGGTTVKVRLPLVPLGVVTLTVCGPSVASEAILKMAVIDVELLTLIVSTVIPDALTLTVVPPVPVTKFVPVRVTRIPLNDVPCKP